VTIDEEVVRDALLRSRPSDLDDLLTTIEAYRASVRTAQHLRRTRCMQEQRDQALECAGYCRKLLEDFAATGRIASVGHPTSGEARFTFAFSWAE
jgi:hypothetical protein